MRRLLLKLFLGGTVALLLVRCSSFETAPSVDVADVVDADVSPDATTDPPDARTGCDPSCGGDAGPCSVRVDTSCIDATELTVSDYRAFANVARATEGSTRASRVRS